MTAIAGARRCAWCASLCHATSNGVDCRSSICAVGKRSWCCEVYFAMCFGAAPIQVVRIMRLMGEAVVVVVVVEVVEVGETLGVPATGGS